MGDQSQAQAPATPGVALNPSGTSTVVIVATDPQAGQAHAVAGTGHVVVVPPDSDAVTEEG